MEKYPEIYNINREKGDTYGMEFRIVKNGIPFPLSLYDINIYVLSSFEDENVDALFSILGVKTDAANGVIEFAPSASQADLLARGVYYYRMVMGGPPGVPPPMTTILKGKYIIA